MSKKSGARDRPIKRADSAKIPEPANGWYSLGLLLEHYTPATLANAIDSCGVFVIDSVGRRVLASDLPEAQSGTRSYALSLLADRFSEMENPGPEYSWESERWQLEVHPTYFFGWPAELLPDFGSFVKTPVVQKSNPAAKDWTQRPSREFIEEKRRAGSFEAAGVLHGVSRQRYSEVYQKVTKENS